MMVVTSAKTILDSLNVPSGYRKLLQDNAHISYVKLESFCMK